MLNKSHCEKGVPNLVSDAWFEAQLGIPSTHVAMVVTSQLHFPFCGTHASFPNLDTKPLPSHLIALDKGKTFMKLSPET